MSSTRFTCDGVVKLIFFKLHAEWVRFSKSVCKVVVSEPESYVAIYLFHFKITSFFQIITSFLCTKNSSNIATTLNFNLMFDYTATLGSLSPF